MSRFLIVILSLILTACAQTYDPTQPLKENTGLVVAKFRMSGIHSANFLTRNTNRILDNYSFAMKGSEKLFVFPMSAGTHALDQVLYMQGSGLVDPDLDCLGTFTIEPGTVNYIGDVYFDVGGYNNYIIFSTHNSSILVKDERVQTYKEFETRYPNVAKKFTRNESIIGPSACE
ncbi:hypothetical protein A7985_11025 [Pseudoalteromonas luteoviolacea]|uniref:Lipoprotein n=1 Tax=Pseudoalteromonas luteoviolacea TaxID=43657 RepID=A0A1C0TQB6_9GAMM|nr:hypothetical protein [Pseudoalteromonas luteoviolacea]OCQ21159.1 hypothetical protein A7985_11025 [Pseudoalteromonas luteoviolacea]